MDKDPILDLYDTQLADLDHDFKDNQAKLRTTNDPTNINRLEREIQRIGQKMTKIQQDRQQRQDDLRQISRQSSLDALIALLESYMDEIDLFVQSYQRTTAHWSAQVKPGAKIVSTILSELARIPPGPIYTAQDEFIAYVVNDTADVSLASGLIAWGQRFHPNQDWLQLYRQIQADDEKRLEQSQPAILITISPGELDSAKSNEDFYQINAVLIEDIETYKSKKTGYHPLVVIDSPDSDPCHLDDLTDKITGLLQNFLAEKNRICPSCRHNPQIHVFLPIKIIDLGVDVLRLNSLDARRPEFLGHDHVVVIRCANRYERTYRKRSRWLRFWDRQQQLLEKMAHQVFIPGHDDDLDELMKLLDQVVKSEESEVVGLQVPKTPVDVQELCYELLDAGLPLALWPRQN